MCVQICCYFAGRIYAVKHPHLRVAIKKRVMALNVLNCVDLPSEMSSHTHAPTHTHAHTHTHIILCLDRQNDNRSTVHIMLMSAFHSTWGQRICAGC